MYWQNLKKWGLATFIFLFVCILGLNRAEAASHLVNTTIKVALYPVGAPQGFIFEDLTKPQGFDIDVIYELQKRLGFRIAGNRILPMNLKEAFDSVKNGDADILIGGISYSEERSKFFDSTVVLFTSSLTIMYNSKENPGIKSLKDFKGKRIGVIPGSVYENFLTEIGAIPVRITNVIETYFQVFYGRLDGYIGDRPPLEDFVNAFHSDKLAILQEPFGEEYCKYVFILGKDSPYTEVISRELKRMIEDGTMGGLLKFWHIEHCAVGDAMCTNNNQ